MLVRVAFTVFTNEIEPQLLLNMDETPLMLTLSAGKTWAKKGSSNVFAFGSEDKRQDAGTPWIKYLEERSSTLERLYSAQTVR